MSTKVIAVLLSILLTACATRDLPPDPPSSPASAQAQESRERVPSLATDETTQAINARLSETKKPAEKTESGNDMPLNSDDMQGMEGMQQGGSPAASPAQPKKF